MRNYLSFGGGVNSVACAIAFEFDEIVFCDTGCEWPETYEYINMFSKIYPITILKPTVQGFKNIYDFYWSKKTIPSRAFRDCTAKFKIRPKLKYFKKPCFNNIAFDYGERNRAKLNFDKGVEARFPLIEHEIDRNGCIEIIKSAGFPVPPKSACYFCFNSKRSDWIRLRQDHPCLYNKALKIEQRCNMERKRKGLKRIGLGPQYKTISSIVNEDQRQIFEQDEYPPCNCGL